MSTVPSVFLSHNKADKSFARRLAIDLGNQGARYWLDEAEIKVGESLIEKIREGIDSVDYVVAVLSPDSVASPWVQREVDVAMNQEILGRKVKVLPVMYRHCDLPGFLLGKKYADFTDEARYAGAFEELTRSLGMVFNRLALNPAAPESNLGKATDRAFMKALPLLSRPFHRPFQYMGMSVQDAVAATAGTRNEGGNIVVDSDECHMFLEVEGNFVNYVDAELTRTAPHLQSQEFEAEPVLGAFSINPAELELVRKQTHCHTYYDHRRKLKITVSCLYDGGPLTVSFSSKYYGM